MIHYNNALNPAQYNIPLCSPNADFKTTTDKGQITCKNCLKRFDKSWRQLQGRP